MPSLKTPPLPKGWKWGEYEERLAQLRQLSPCVRVLLAAEWARSVLPIFEAAYPNDARPRKAIEAAEAWVKAPTSAADAARAAARAAAAAAAADADAKWRWVFATYRHAKGPGYDFDPAWRTSDTVALAQGIVTERAFDRMPILADALQDAGFSDIEVIEHLQDDADEWTSADWIICNLLGYGA